jgi:hypothetical protein
MHTAVGSSRPVELGKAVRLAGAKCTPDRSSHHGIIAVFRSGGIDAITAVYVVILFRGETPPRALCVGAIIIFRAVVLSIIVATAIAGQTTWADS